nr:GDP-mannose 4,6-dehydratase [Deltaproteobacteria bacterium]
MQRGLQVRDFLHVSDVAGGLVAVLRSGVAGAVNVGSGEPVTVREVVTRLGAMIGRPELLRLGAIDPKAGEPAFVCADNAKLRAETGWKAAYTLDSGLADTVRWWRARMDSATAPFLRCWVAQPRYGYTSAARSHFPSVEPAS